MAPSTTESARKDSAAAGTESYMDSRCAERGGGGEVRGCLHRPTIKHQSYKETHLNMCIFNKSSMENTLELNPNTIGEIQLEEN